jgi:rubrerythrin
MDANRPISTTGELLRAALVKEQQAHDFYDHAILQCKIKMVQELLEKLKDEESHHLRLIHDMLTKLELG